MGEKVLAMRPIRYFFPQIGALCRDVGAARRYNLTAACRPGELPRHRKDTVETRLSQNPPAA